MSDPNITRDVHRHVRFYLPLDCALSEELGALIVALDGLTKAELESLIEAVQMIDTEAQDALERAEAEAANGHPETSA